MVRFTAAVWLVLGLGACFTGGFLAGQPCQSDADCGPSLACDGGFCGGTSGAGTSTTAPVTTGTSTTTVPTTTGSETSTGGDTTTTGGTTTTGDPTTGPVTTDDSTTGPTCGLGRCADLDLVVVVDNSPSMGDKANTLLAALLSFEKYVAPEITQACSIHMGVTTTDLAYQFNPPECQLPGALVQVDFDGNVCETVEGTPYATLADLDELASLLCLIRVGAQGSNDERPIESMLEVFNPNVNDLDQCNKGFVRKDTPMVMIIAADEDDDDNDAQGNSGSNIPTSLWHDSLTTLKPEEDLLMIGLLGDDDQMTTMCPWMPLADADGSGAEASPALQSFFASFPPDHSVVGSLCQPPDAGIYDALMMEVRDKLRIMCEV
jgi:hypothetical protein